jgi:hypothetical protein
MMASLTQFHERGGGRSDTVASKSWRPGKSWHLAIFHASRTLAVIPDSMVKMAS